MPPLPPEHPGPPWLFYEKPEGSGSGAAEAGYVYALAALVGGVLTLFWSSGSLAMAGGAGLVAAGVLCYIALLRRPPPPPVPCFIYFWLDQYGVHHIEGGRRDDRVAHFAWHEIAAAEATSPKEEFQFLILELNRARMRGVPVYLGVDDPREAAAAIRAVIAAQQQP